MNKFVWMGCLSYLLTGVAHVVVGSVLPDLLSHYGLNYKDGGLLIFAQFAGFLAGVLTTPWFSVRLGRRGVILLAIGCLFAAQIVYSALPPWYFILAAGPVAGFGFGMIEAAIGALVIAWVESNKAVVMSRLEVFFGVGALLMPAVSGVLILNGLWHVAFYAVAGLSFVLLLAWKFMSFGPVDEWLMKAERPQETTLERGTALNGNHALLLVMMALFFSIYVGVEMSVVNFLPSILIEKINADEAVAAMSVSFFWGTMVAGRLFCGIAAEKISYTRYILLSCVGSLVMFICFSFAFNLWSSLLLILFLGLCMSGIFAIALLYANHLLPGQADKVVSIMVASGGVGGAVLPLLLGWTMDRFPVDTAMGLVVVFFIALLLLFWGSLRIRRSGETTPS